MSDGGGTRPLAVVIVDDSPDDRAEIRRLLLLGSERRYRFIEAETGAAAIAACQAGSAGRDGAPDGPPDCVILDFYLPDMNGGEVLEALRAGGPLTICPVLMLTGDPDEGRGPAMLRAGAQDYLNKSGMNAESLYRSLENAIERHRMSREAQQREAALQQSQEQLARALSSARLTEDALRTSQARLAGIAASAMDAIVSIAEDGRVLFFNQAAERMFGMPAAEALGSSHERFLPQRYHATHAEQVRRFGQTGITARSMGAPGTVMALRADGEEFPVEATISQFLDGGQRIFTVIMRDITQRVRNDEERAQLLRSEQAARLEAQDAQGYLRQATELLATALDVPSMLDVVVQGAVRALADGAFIEVVDGQDPGGAQTGIRWHAAGGRDAQMAQRASRLREQVPWDDFPSGRMQVLRTGQPRLFADAEGPQVQAVLGERIVAVREAGVRSCLLVPLTVRERTLGVLSCFILDPGRRRFDERDVAAAQDLARAAALAIDHALLYQQAQRAIGARDHVLRVVAHDLRGPLNAINLGAGWLLRSPELSPERVQSHLERIQLAVSQADHLIGDLLDAARVAAGTLAVVLSPQRPAQLVAAAVEQVQLPAVERGLSLQVEVAEGLPVVQADRDRTLQVLANLLGNALKFTPAGGRITVRAMADGGTVIFAVSDTGPGIAKAHQQHLFAPFWQARPEEKQGAGLGLSIARGLVEAQGGKLWVESEEGAGATFAFTLRAPP